MVIDRAKILEKIIALKPSHIIIGYSGGLDSSVLLNICKSIRIPIIAVHINHNIHSQSKNWQIHCEKICQTYGIKFIFHALDQVPKKENFEAWSSKQRMIFFQNIMSQYSGSLLLLGHHLDDQAETFLLQAIRGSGLAGLAAMPHHKILKYGSMLRPLLSYPRDKIERFAADNNISHINDSSNENNKYRRNLLRNKIIPILKQINPSINKTLSRSASICAQSNNILNKLFTEKLSTILKDDAIKDDAIKIDQLLKHEINIQLNLLRLWFKNITCLNLKARQLESIAFSLNNKITTGWQFNINHDHKLIVEYNLLKIIKLKSCIKKDLPINKQTIINWLTQHCYQEEDVKKIIIRDKRSSDRCKYPGRHKNNTLKILFQELKIPSHERLKTKVILLNNKIIAIYPFFICRNDENTRE